MLKALLARVHQGHRTMRYPAEPPVLPAAFQGRPEIDRSRCPSECSDCAAACPTNAVTRESGSVAVDLGRCLFCGECVDACSPAAIRFGAEYRLATSTREALVADGREYQLAHALEAEARKLFGRSLKLRQVSAGGCNACEADINVLGTVSFDLGRFGIQIVASPRHADGLLVTGPVTENMRLALEKTWKAVPPPRLVIAVGTCAISGGLYADHPEVQNGVAGILPVDLFVPGCPPHPVTILDGLLRLLGKIKD